MSQGDEAGVPLGFLRAFSIRIFWTRSIQRST